jgi:hypothetical protein
MTESLLEGSVVVVLVYEFFVNTYFQEQNLKSFKCNVSFELI